MMPSKHEDITTALAHLTDAIQAQAAKPQSPRRRRGRPSQGIRSEYTRVEVYLAPDVRDALDRLADRRETQTSRSVRRSDIIRAALTEYLCQHLPEAGI
jgi:hypothetical protein